MVVQRKMAVGHNQHMYIAVNAAVESEIRLLRVDRAVGAVVNRDCQGILCGQRGCQVDAEGRVAACMAGQFLTIQGDNSAHGYALKFQPDLLAFGMGGGGKFLCISTGSAEIIVAAVGAVLGVPCVGQGNSMCGLAGLGKLPALIETDHRAHDFALLIKRCGFLCL